MLKVSYMRYHKPKKELCDSEGEFTRWKELYELQLNKRKKPIVNDIELLKRYEKRKEVNRKSCQKYYYSRKGVKENGTN